MKLTDAEFTRLRTTKNEQEWSATCDDIKKARDGQYPPDWWPRMQMSGEMARIARGWGKPDAFDIKIGR